MEKGKKGSIIPDILLAILAALCFLVALSVRWAVTTWSNLKMDELIYELTAPLEGTGNGMIEEYIIKAAIPAVAIGIAVFVILRIFGRKRKVLTRVIAAVTSLAVLAASVGVFWDRLDVGAYLDGQTNTSAFIEENYADPAATALTFPEKKRNLIYIFLESVEMTYADEESGGAFPENVIPELTQLAMDNEDFSGDDPALDGGISYPGTTWTMGAMFAQTSGLPLKISVGTNNMDTMEDFFPDITTMGDILKQNGYAQTLLIGSNATFGGRRLYFSQHGDYKMEDYEYARETGRIPDDYKVFWGYEDEKLISFAKESLTELASGTQPFNLTMLTVDTHFEDGYKCRLCPDTFGDDRYANAMACSSKQITEFVDWIRQQDFYENTTIVISGDHPTMDSDFCLNVPSDYERRVYTVYINADAETDPSMGRREYCTFDNFPTTLAALGVKIDGERLGLGTNLYSTTPTLTEEYGAAAVEDELNRKSIFLSRLEKVDLMSEAYMARAGFVTSAEVYFDSRDDETGETVFRIARPIYLDEALTSVRFDILNEESVVEQSVEAEALEDRSYIVRVTLTEDQMLNAGVEVHGIGASGEDYKLFSQIGSLYLTAIQNLPEYLKGNRAILNDCAVFFVVKDEGSVGLTGESREGMESLGLKAEFGHRQSYAALIDGDHIEEETSDERIRKEGTLSDGSAYYMHSGGYYAGGTSKVRIDGVNYIKQHNRGLTIVTYYKPTKTVIGSRLFDTYIGEPGADVTISDPSLFGNVKVLVENIVGCDAVGRSGHKYVNEVTLEYWTADEPSTIYTAKLKQGENNSYSGKVKISDFKGKKLYYRFIAKNENARCNEVAFEEREY